MTKAKAKPATVTIPQLSGGSHRLTLGQILFAAWRCADKDKRQPATRQELADRLGVDRTTTYAWEQNPDVLAAIRVLGRRHGESEYGRVMAAVAAQAIGGSVAHARLYFELMGDLAQEAVEAAFKKGVASVQITTVQVLGDVTFDSRRLEVSPELANRISRAGGDGHGKAGG